MPLARWLLNAPTLLPITSAACLWDRPRRVCRTTASRCRTGRAPSAPGPRVQVRAADGLIRGTGRIRCRL